MTNLFEFENTARELDYFDFQFTPLESFAIEKALEVFRTTAEKRLEALWSVLELVRHRSVGLSVWSNYCDNDWNLEFQNLVDRMLTLGLANEAQLTYAYYLSELDAYRAYHFLLSSVSTAIEIEIGNLRSATNYRTSCKRTDWPSTRRHPRSLQSADLLHGMISLQREWFLHHGSHPSRAALNRVRGCEGVSTYSS